MKIVFVPALIVVLIDKEQEMGRELTRQDVGYRDIDPENVWGEWLAYKAG